MTASLPLSHPESIKETCSVVLTFESMEKSYGVTFQMKPPRQYFCRAPFVS